MNPKTHLKLVEREITAHPIHSIDDLTGSIPTSDIELNVEGPLSSLAYLIFQVHKGDKKTLISRHVSIATAIYSSLKGNFLYCSETTGNGHDLGDFNFQRDKDYLVNTLINSDRVTSFQVLTPEEIDNPYKVLIEYYTRLQKLSDPSRKVLVKDNPEFELNSQKGYYAYFLMKTREGITPSIVFQDIDLNLPSLESFNPNRFIKEYFKQYYEQPDVKATIQTAMKANRDTHFTRVAGYLNRCFHSKRCFVKVI